MPGCSAGMQGKCRICFFYIDGHVRVYHGDLATLPKRFVSREKLCLSGTTEFWVNDQQGLPLMVVTGELNEKLKWAIEQIIPKITSEITQPAKPGEPAFTIVVDCEAYEPAWFKKLWVQYHVAIITYLKSANLIEKINGYTDEIKVLLAKRKDQPSRISIAEMPPQQRYNKLLIESKKLKNAIIMVAYRAESALYNTMSEFYKSTQKEGRVI